MSMLVHLCLICHGLHHCCDQIIHKRSCLPSVHACMMLMTAPTSCNCSQVAACVPHTLCAKTSAAAMLLSQHSKADHVLLVL